MALDKIRLIASYERKIIRRHLLFWIFLICIVFGITGVQWYLQVDSTVWVESALSATVPYMNDGCSICYNLYWLSLSGWNLSGGIGS